MMGRERKSCGLEGMDRRGMGRLGRDRKMRTMGDLETGGRGKRDGTKAILVKRSCSANLNDR